MSDDINLICDECIKKGVLYTNQHNRQFVYCIHSFEKMKKKLSSNSINETPKQTNKTNYASIDVGT